MSYPNRLAWLLLLTLPLLLATRYAVTLTPESTVTYQAMDSRDSWTGQAPVESLNLIFDDANLRNSALEISVNPGKFDSGNFIRDANARRAVFETGTYPEISFVATGLRTNPITLPATLPVGTTRTIVLAGTLTMHGVSRPLELPVSVERTGGSLRATGSFEVRLSDYEMTRPDLFGIKVNDEVTISFDVVGALETP